MNYRQALGRQNNAVAVAVQRGIPGFQGIRPLVHQAPPAAVMNPPQGVCIPTPLVSNPPVARTKPSCRTTRLQNLRPLVHACCTLHNICEEKGDPFRGAWLDGVNDPMIHNVNNNVNTPAIEIRDALKSYFARQ